MHTVLRTCMTQSQLYTDITVPEVLYLPELLHVIWTITQPPVKYEILCSHNATKGDNTVDTD